MFIVSEVLGPGSRALTGQRDLSSSRDLSGVGGSAGMTTEATLSDSHEPVVLRKETG